MQKGISDSVNPVEGTVTSIEPEFIVSGDLDDPWCAHEVLKGWCSSLMQNFI